MLYSEVMNRLSEMRSRFDEGFSSSDRLFLRDLSVAVLGRPVRNTSCKDCYRDAYIEISVKLKRLGAMPKEKKFYLRAGVLLHFAGGMYVNENLTDDIALDALNDNRNRLDLFQKVPDNLEELLAARKAIVAEKQAAVEDTSKEDLLKQIDGLKAVNQELTEKLEGAEKSIAAVNGELEAAKAQIENGAAPAEEVERLNAALVEKDSVIAEKDAAIAEKDAKIAELEKLLEAAKAPAPEAAPAEEAPAEEAPKDEQPAEAPAGQEGAEAPKGKGAAKK